MIINTDLIKTKRKVILIGDSYAEGFGDPNLKGWSKYVIEYLNNYGISALEYYEGGSGFVAVGNSGHTFLQLLQNADISDKEEITDIVVCGGYNDRTSTKTIILNAINSFMSFVKINYPNARLLIGMCANHKDDASIRGQLDTVLNAYKNANDYGAIYIENIELSNKNEQLFYSDKVHLTDYSYIGKSIFNSLMGYGANIIDNKMYSYTETLIGKGVLGENIYRRVISATAPDHNDWYDIPVGIINTLYKYQCIVAGNDGATYDASYLGGGGTSPFIIIPYYNGNTRFKVSSDVFKGCAVRIVMEYTK